MNYKELKEQLKEVKRQHLEKTKEKQALAKELSSLDGERNELDSMMQSEIKSAKNAELQKEEQIISKPFEVRIEKLEAKRNSLKNNYQSTLSRITTEEYSKSYQEDLTITSDIKESVKVAKTSVETNLGKRFTDELYNQLSNKEVALDIGDLEDISSKLADITKEVERMSYKSKTNIFEKIDEIFNKFNPCKEDDTSSEEYIRKQVIRYLIICGIISFAVIYFCAPYLLILVVILGAFNIYKNWRIYSLVLDCKLIEDNLQSIEKIISDTIINQVNKDRAVLQKKYETKEENINNMLAKLNDAMQTKLLDIRKTYMFDDSAIQNKYHINKASIDNKELSLKSSIAQEENNLIKLQKLIDNLELKLSEATESLKGYYLNYKSKSKEVILDDNFLLDIRDRKPIFWNCPEQSCLFVYENDKDAINFIRLISLQLFVRLNLFSIAINVWDKRTMGTYMQAFTTAPESMISIAYSDDTISESLELLYEIIGKRLTVITREFKDIKEYNNRMLELDSLAESYRFVFILHPSDNLLSDDSFVQLLINGGPVGIFPLIFMTPSEIEHLGKNANEFIDSVACCYTLSSDEVSPKAKEFIKETYVKND